MDFSAIAGFLELSTRVRIFGGVRIFGYFWRGKNRGKNTSGKGKNLTLRVRRGKKG